MRVDPEVTLEWTLEWTLNYAMGEAAPANVGEDGLVPDSQSPAESRPERTAESRPERPRLYRSTSDRYIAGVCGGIAAHLGVSSGLVRVVMVVAGVAGPGILVYGFFWALTRPDTAAPDGVPVAAPPRHLQRNQVLLVAGAVFLVLGLGWGGPTGQLGRHLGLVLPVVVVAAGAFLAWSQLDDAERGSPRARTRLGRTLAVARPLLGVALTAVGVVALATQGQGFDVVASSALAAFAVLVGAAVVAAPWVLRMWRGLQSEQAERIRATERADIAAHLHDSVLQTLALIQRRAEDPATVVRLARSQERELRGWLYADQHASRDSLARAVETAAHEVEDDHGVAVDVVVTGDRPLDPGGVALVKAAREAMLNAVRHGAPPVSAYVEVGPDGVEAFVRDHGEGFDLAAIGDDRLGVRESILGRMSRHGGAAKIRRLEHGTEVELTLPPLAPVPSAAPAGPAPAGPAPAAASVPEHTPTGEPA